MVKHSRSWKLPDREFTSEPTVVISKKVLTLGCRTGIGRHRLRACNGLLGREDRKKGRAWDECFIIWLHSAASLEDSCRPRQRGMPHTTSCWMLLTGENKAVTANKSKNNNSYKICLYFMLCRRTHAHTFSLSHYDCVSLSVNFLSRSGGWRTLTNQCVKCSRLYLTEASNKGASVLTSGWVCHIPQMSASLKTREE